MLASEKRGKERLEAGLKKMEYVPVQIDKIDLAIAEHVKKTSSAYHLWKRVAHGRYEYGTLRVGVMILGTKIMVKKGTENM